MKKLFLTILCLVFCFYYVNSTCFQYSDKYKADKKTCLDRTVNTTDEDEWYGYEYYRFFDKKVDTCCYVEYKGIDDSTGKEETAELCLAFNKGTLGDDMKKFKDYKKELEKELKEYYGSNYDSKMLDSIKEPDIDCFSSFLNFGFLALMVLLL